MMEDGAGEGTPGLLELPAFTRGMGQVGTLNVAFDDTASSTADICLPPEDGSEDGSVVVAGGEGPPSPRAGRQGGITLQRSISMEKMSHYCSSAKGKDLSMATSVLYALVMTVLSLSLLLSIGLAVGDYTDSPDGSTNGTHHLDLDMDELADSVTCFFISVKTVGLLCLVVILVLAARGRLTKDNRYRDQSNMTFLRGGVLALGTGGILYMTASISTYFLVDAPCRNSYDLADVIVGICFTATQVAFLLCLSKVHINYSLGVTILGRYLMMHVIASNLCVWVRTVHRESMVQIDSNQEDPMSLPAPHTTETPAGGCDLMLTLAQTIEPYTFPLLIEFSASASTILLGVWENCGTTHHHSQRSVKRCSEINGGGSLQHNSAISRTAPHQGRKKYYNNNLGFVTGWVLVSFTLVIIITNLFCVYSVSCYIDTAEKLIYGTNLVLTCVCLVTIPVTMYQMSFLTFKDDEIRSVLAVLTGQATRYRTSIHRSMDRNLLMFTLLALLTFRIMSSIAAVELESPIILADSIVSIGTASLQTLFVNWFATQKRSTTARHLEAKPGRQGLELLRCTNFALWLINTFLVKHPNAKHIQDRAFGFTAWAILSNVLQPLTILFYFHSFCCLAEVITQAYTDKYIGLVRPSKLRTRDEKLAEDDVVVLEDQPGGSTSTAV